MKYIKKVIVFVLIAVIVLIFKNYDSYTLSSNPVILDDKLFVNFIDVGQGDSIFIELPNNETMLIDAGEKYESANVIDFINDKGYSKIDYLIGTHPHSDHIGGLTDVINSYDVKEIYLPKVIHTSQTYETLLNTIDSLKLKVNAAFSGMVIFQDENLKITILSPTVEEYSNLNNYSVVVKLEYGATSFLFMGDAEALVEKDIIEYANSDVIKVGHHGSDTSSSIDFVNTVDADYAVIMSGKDNQYDLPSSNVVDRWTESGAKVFNTSVNGNIIFSSDGNNIFVEVEYEGNS